MATWINTTLNRTGLRSPCMFNGDMYFTGSGTSLWVSAGGTATPVQLSSMTFADVGPLIVYQGALYYWAYTTLDFNRRL